ncbi:MAG: alpha/beta hydrolase [Candidatus Thorarchaeota archaeon]|jgi:alpha-beta hydrolase superfamily lysophospholipase
MTLRVQELRENFEGTHRLVNSSDGITLFLREWKPEGEAEKETAILILHGITAHSGPYEILGKPISNLGYPTFGLDLRGHGLSDGNRGDCPSGERYAKDLCETVSFLKSEYTHIVLLGHSLGVYSSLLVMNNCLTNIAGAVLLSGGREMKPGMFPSMALSTKLNIALNSLVFPSKPVIEYRREGMVGLDDPLFNFKYTLRFMRMLDFAGMEFPEELNIPVFVGVGDTDELFSVESVRDIYNSVPSEDKEFYVQPGARHAVFPEGSWQPLMEWLAHKFI